MVPVLDSQNNPLMPCSEKRARQMMEKGQAKDYWQKGIFCIKLTKEPSDRQYQEVALGIDPGSKREGYTVATSKSVVLNITTNTPDWVKGHVETRRNLRRNRRNRKTPYRQCRKNRSTLRKVNRIPPSTKARWNAKLRITKQLLKIIPITIINVEDIKAVSKEGKKRWNKSFSSLETGKNCFYTEIEKLDVKLIKTSGLKTYAHRTTQGYVKSKSKLDYKWEAHNSDSHCLIEMALGKTIKPFYGLYRIDFLRFHRRQLHILNPVKGGFRKQYGSTVSLGISRGSVVKYKNKLYYLGGNSKGKVSLHSIISGKRIFLNKKILDIKILYSTKQRAQFSPVNNHWGSLPILG